MKKWVDNLRWKKIILNFLRLSLVVVIVCIALIISLSFPSVQSFLTGKVIKGIREKSGTIIRLQSVEVSFPNTIWINDLFIQDQDKDTLLCLKTLKVKIGLFKLLSNEVSINSVELNDAVVHLSRKNRTKGFNFQYLVDHFVKDGEKKIPDSLAQKRTPWLFDLGEILLNQVHFTYEDSLSGVDFGLDLEKFQVKVDKIDLAGHLISIQKSLLKNATLKVARAEVASITEGPITPKKLPDSLPEVDAEKDGLVIFPGWDISVDQLLLESTNILFDQKAAPKSEKGMDYNHLTVHQLNAKVKDIHLNEEGIRSVIEQLSFEEEGGFNLRTLAGVMELGRDKAEIRNLHLATSCSEILGDAKIEFANLGALTSDIGNCSLSLDLRKLKLATSDVLLFFPVLSENKYISALNSSGLYLSAKASGKINDLSIGNIELSMLKETKLQVQGKIKGLPEYRKAIIGAEINRLSISRGDLFELIDPATFKGMNLPPAINISGHASGSFDSFKADASLGSLFGDLTATIRYDRQSISRRDSFELGFTIKNLNVGAIMGNSLAGNLTSTGEIAGSSMGFAPGSLSCSASLNILNAEYNHYNFTNLNINSRIRNNLVTATASSNDPGLQFNLSSEADLRDKKMRFSSKLDLMKLDLQAMNFSDRELEFQTNLAATLSFTDFNSAEATVELKNTQLSGTGKSVPVKMIHIHALSESDSLNFHVQSDLADLYLSGKVNPKHLPKIVQSSYQKYFGLSGTDESFPACALSFQGVVKKQDILRDYIPGLKGLVVKRLDGTYKGFNNQLDIHAELPVVVYDKIHLDSLHLAIHGENDSISMDLGLTKIAYDSLIVKNIKIVEQVSGGIVHSTVKVLDASGKPKYLFANEIDFKPDFYKISFLPEGLILDGVPWKTENENLLKHEEGRVSSQRINFTNDKQSFGLIAQGKTRKFVFSEFELKNLANIASYKGKENLVNGILSGEIALSAESELPLVKAGIIINQLAFLDSVMGKLSFDLQITRDRLDINAKIEDNQNNIVVSGQMDQLSGTPTLDMKAMLRISEPQHFERLSLGYLSKMTGQIEGDLTIRGTSDTPQINGSLGFYNTLFNVNALNLRAKLNNEKFLIDGKGIHFQDFVIEDAREKKLILNGDLLTNYSNTFQYNLHIEAKEFQPVNSTQTDNPVFFGQLNLDNDIWLKGELLHPRIEADVKINGSTNLTLVMPGDELKLVSSDGIVKFRDATNLSDTTDMTKQADYVTDSIISKLSGIDLRMNLEVSPDARFRVDINPKSGDYLAISGSAKLNISSTLAGNQSITGVFEAKTGNYQLSFFGLVKKSFAILPGSTVSWSGRPMEAEVDLTAGYSVRSSSVALMSNETSGMSEAEKNAFKQRLPYEVKLHIRGFPAKPDIKFEIDLPDKYLAEYPLIATKLDKLNSEEMTSELNKQVFALLVTGGFIADSSADPSTSSSATGIASTAARNSVNGILADQMNNFSSRYINNVDVNFGLTSYEDYGGGSSAVRTDLDVQLSKKMFNNRLTVEAQGSFDLSGNKKNTGTSTEKTNGEVGAIYQLTKSNEYKLKVYYKNIYDLFEGELTCSGIALIHEKEYDSLRKKKNQEKARKRFIERNFKK